MTIMDVDDLSPGEIVFSADETNDADGGASSTIFGVLFNKSESGYGFANNLTGLIVLCIILTIIVIIFFGCYLMMRFMHRTLSNDDSKDPMASNQYSNVVMHPKRVYEIQAEEGCFTAPGIAESEEDYEPPISSLSTEENKVKKPESGDLKSIRSEPSKWSDDPKDLLRKKQKVHKDSVCAYLFRPNVEPKMV